MATVRRVLVGLAWLYVMGNTVQFFLAGLGLLGDQPSALTTHADFGWA